VSARRLEGPSLTLGVTAYMLNQLLSIAGAILILVAYTLLQAKRIPFDSLTYQIMNAVGGMFLCTAAVWLRQYGFILLEGVWTLISVVGLWRVVTRRS
jgi:hypothetical protein